MVTKDFKPYLAMSEDIVEDISNSFLKLTEYKKEELLGQNVYHLLNNMMRLSTKLDKLEDIRFNHAYFIFTKNHKYREVNINLYREANKSYLAFKEIPGTRVQERFPFLFQQIQDNFYGMALFSADDFTLLTGNQKYKDIIKRRYGCTDITGKKIYEFSYGWEKSRMKEAWMQVLETGRTYQVYEYKSMNLLTNKEEYVDRSITPLMIDNQIRYLAIMLNDVTEKVLFRKQNEEQRKLIEKQKEQLETVIEQMSDAVFIIDKEGKYIIENKAAKEYFDIEMTTAEEAYCLAEFFELDGDKIPFEKMPVYFMMQGKTVLDRIMFMKSSRKEAYISLNATPIFDQEGNFLMGIMSSRDVTEYIIRNETIKKQQQLLLEAQKKEKENLEKMINMKDEFLSLISHEFKTPLTVINSALQAMELICGKELSQKAHMFLDKIKQNTYRQLRLVNNLLDLTKANAGHLKVAKRNVDIVFITRSIVESVRVYAQQKGVNLSFVSAFEYMLIALDEEKYERILLNLLSNSIKFTPEGKDIEVRLCKHKNNLSIEIKDQGVGIPEEKQEIIFERFGQVDSTYTRKAEGTGIGLCLVKLLVEGFGGKISLESKVGQGSTFRIELPISLLENQEQTETSMELVDTRFIQALDIEFSDIYF